MKKTHTALAACTLIATALTGCGGQSGQAKEAVTTAPATAPAPAETPTASAAGLAIEATHRATGELIATYTFTGKAEVQCAGKTMLQLDFAITAEPGTMTAPNYHIGDWRGYKNGMPLKNAGATTEAIECTPGKYRSVSINPGESAELTVVLDTTDADAVGYSPGFTKSPIALTL